MKLLYYFFSILIFTAHIYAQNDGEANKPYKIADIIIGYKSTKNFDSDEIKNILQTGRTESFNKSVFILDIQRIEKFYFDRGYFDATVDTLTVKDSAEHSIKITFSINEGYPYRIEKIFYEGLDSVDEQTKTKLFNRDDKRVIVSDIFNRDNLSIELERMAGILTNNGYAFAVYSPPEVTKIKSFDNTLAKIVTIKIIITPGDRYKFGNTIVLLRNNKYGVSDTDVKDAAVYENGGIYRKDELIESENRMSRLPMLEIPRIKIDKIDTVNNRIDLKVEAAVRNEYELDPEIFGYDITNQFYFGAGLSFTDRYFFGGGRTLSLNVSGLLHNFDNSGVEFTSTLSQPNIFNNNKITGSWKITANLFQLELFSTSKLENSIGVIYELPKFTYVNDLLFDWKLKNDRYTFKQITPGIYNDSVYSIPANSSIDIFTSSVDLSVIHNSTDNFQFPVKGFYQAFLVEESGLLGGLIRKILDVSTVNYIKFSFVNKFYFDLSGQKPNSVIASKFLIGAVFEYGDNTLKINGLPVNIEGSIIPIESRFIAGGSSSVRGWGAKTLGTFPERRNGGNFILEGSFEHRTRPFIDSKNFILKDLGFVTFFDYGNLWETPSKFRISDIALAIGGGIRYYTIVGPVRFDVGFKLYDYEADGDIKKWLFENDFSTIFSKQIQFQIGIGHTF